MPLLISDEECLRCSDDPSIISQKDDAFITQLQSDLKINEDMLKCKDDKIKKLELKIEALQNELSSTKDLAAATQEHLSSANKLVEIYKQSSDEWSRKAIKLEEDCKEKIDKDVIQLVQSMEPFCGSPDEDPYAHIASFLRICNIFETNDAFKLRLFAFSLQDKALWWFESLSDGPVTTWDTMAEKFTWKYFPQSKVYRYRLDIEDFSQMDGESLYVSWERFKDLLRRCPHHEIPLWSQVEIFYYGLSDQTRQSIVPWYTLSRKTPEDAFDLLEDTAIDDHHRRARIMKPYTHTQGALTRKMGQMQVSCELPHPSRDCQQGNLNASYEQFVWLHGQSTSPSQ